MLYKFVNMFTIIVKVSIKLFVEQIIKNSIVIDVFFSLFRKEKRSSLLTFEKKYLLYNLK